MKKIMIEKEKIDTIINNVRKFEQDVSITDYEAIQSQVKKLVDNEFDEEVLFIVIWKCIKLEKSNKRIYSILNKLGFGIKGEESEDD